MESNVQYISLSLSFSLLSGILFLFLLKRTQCKWRTVVIHLIYTLVHQSYLVCLKISSIGITSLHHTPLTPSSNFYEFQ
jgi:hypothetical protein